MNKLLHKITAITLSLLVLFASLSFKVASHYCGEQMISTAYLGKAKTCKDIKAGACCEEKVLTTKESISQESCCTDTISFINGIALVTDYAKKQLQIVINYFVTPNLINPTFLFVKVKNGFNYNYYSIKIIQNFQTNFQTFLI